MTPKMVYGIYAIKIQTQSRRKTSKMSIKISHVIENKLRFLALTRAGKIRLCVFSDKILYKALSLWQRTYSSMPKDPFNAYFSLCLLEAQRLHLEADWNVMNDFPYFDTDGSVTLNDETFDMKKCHDVMHEFGKRKQTPKYYSTNSARGKHGQTFNQGITYWKHGEEYPYPDQAVDEQTNPCKKDLMYIKPLSQDDPSRFNIDQKEELIKAIRSGKMSKKGLSFLRNTFREKPEILQTIDDYLKGEASPDDTQTPMF